MSSPPPLLCFRLSQLLAFYLCTVEGMLGAGSQLAGAARAACGAICRAFRVRQLQRARVWQAHPAHPARLSPCALQRRCGAAAPWHCARSRSSCGSAATSCCATRRRRRATWRRRSRFGGRAGLGWAGQRGARLSCWGCIPAPALAPGALSLPPDRHPAAALRATYSWWRGRSCWANSWPRMSSRLTRRRRRTRPAATPTLRRCWQRWRGPWRKCAPAPARHSTRRPPHGEAVRCGRGSGLADMCMRHWARLGLACARRPPSRLTRRGRRPAGWMRGLTWTPLTSGCSW